MPSEFRDPKNLANWIELDYFRRPSPLRRWRRWIIWGSLVLPLLVVVAAFAFPGASTLFQAGPVSDAHSMFNEDCQRCHTESFQTVRRFLPWNESVRAVSDQACQQCHEGARHSARQVSEPSCSSCHREHRGRTELVAVRDSHCTSCHANLEPHRQGGAPSQVENVTSFPSGHPEFGLWRRQESDPGQLHFNHKAHLAAGGLLTPTGQKRVLQCVDCHVPDSAGRYIQPIKYENHCASCHPLSVQIVGEVKGDPRVEQAVSAFNKIPAPHREPALVRAVLRDRLLEFVRTQPLKLQGDNPQTLDRSVPRSRPLEMATPAQWKWTLGQLNDMERLLFPHVQLEVNERVLFQNAAGCRFCHVEKSRQAGTEAEGLSDLPRYAQTNIRARWFEHSRFSHQSHQMLNCTECHSARESSLTREVLLPRAETCAQCHNSRVKAAYDCNTCHDYHDRGARHELHKLNTIEGFLHKAKH